MAAAAPPILRDMFVKRATASLARNTAGQPSSEVSGSHQANRATSKAESKADRTMRVPATRPIVAETKQQLQDRQREIKNESDHQASPRASSGGWIRKPKSSFRRRS